MLRDQLDFDARLAEFSRRLETTSAALEKHIERFYSDPEEALKIVQEKVKPAEKDIISNNNPNQFFIKNEDAANMLRQPLDLDAKNEVLAKLSRRYAKTLAAAEEYLEQLHPDPETALKIAQEEVKPATLVLNPGLTKSMMVDKFKAACQVYLPQEKEAEKKEDSIFNFVTVFAKKIEDSLTAEGVQRAKKYLNKFLDKYAADCSLNTADALEIERQLADLREKPRFSENITAKNAEQKIAAQNTEEAEKFIAYIARDIIEHNSNLGSSTRLRHSFINVLIRSYGKEAEMDARAKRAERANRDTVAASASSHGGIQPKSQAEIRREEEMNFAREIYTKLDHFLPAKKDEVENIELSSFGKKKQ